MILTDTRETPRGQMVEALCVRVVVEGDVAVDDTRDDEREGPAVLPRKSGERSVRTKSQLELCA